MNSKLKNYYKRIARHIGKIKTCMCKMCRSNTIDRLDNYKNKKNKTDNFIELQGEYYDDEC